MKRPVVHMIKTGRSITPSGRIECFCTILSFMSPTTTIHQDVTCKKCRTLMSYPEKKFVPTKNLSKSQGNE